MYTGISVKSVEQQPEQRTAAKTTKRFLTTFVKLHVVLRKKKIRKNKLKKLTLFMCRLYLAQNANWGHLIFFMSAA